MAIRPQANSWAVADRHRIVLRDCASLQSFAFGIPFPFGMRAAGAPGKLFFESSRWDHPTEPLLTQSRSHDDIGADAEQGITAALTD